MPATKAAQDLWFKGAVGRAMNPDHAYGLQCKDVDDDYVDTLWGTGSWAKILKPENAKDVFARADPKYFTKVLNNPADPNQVPPHGAIINWCATNAVPQGHTAVVDTADVNGLWVIQQDGYIQYPAKRVRLPYVLPNGATVIGWLIPKLEAPKKLATVNEIKQAYVDILERQADPAGLTHYAAYTIDAVRADLKNSAEYKVLSARKAAIAKAAADAQAKQAAMAAEAQRIAEQKAAAERLKEQAEATASAAAEAATNLMSEPPVVVPPVTPQATETITIDKPATPNALVRIMFELWTKLFGKK